MFNGIVNDAINNTKYISIVHCGKDICLLGAVGDIYIYIYIYISLSTPVIYLSSADIYIYMPIKTFIHE